MSILIYNSFRYSACNLDKNGHSKFLQILGRLLLWLLARLPLRCHETAVFSSLPFSYVMDVNQIAYYALIATATV